MSVNRTKGVTRRQFIRASAAMGVSALAAPAGMIYAAGSDKIRLGVVGCGGRGTYDTTNCLNAAENVELVAMGDMFKDRLDSCRRALTAGSSDPNNPSVAGKVKVTDDTCFLGFDAYKKVLESGVNMVILTTPPHFRPIHFEAAVKAGVHVFMEKPVAVDPVGVRSVIKTAELADSKGLTVVAGTQMRRIAHMVEGMKRIHDGAIGELVSGQCVRIGGGMMDWGGEPPVGVSDMEWHLRRWLFLTWLSGDFIAEMHVHNLDLVNWAFGGPPARCIMLGGRQVGADPKYGDVYDHISGEYEYPSGARVEYIGSQIDGLSVRCDQWFVGAKGKAFMDFAQAVFYDHKGNKTWEYNGESPSPVLKQHADQIAAIRSGARLNEAVRIAESSLTAVMGRMSAYTGRSLKYEWALKASKLDLSPPEYKLGPLDMPPIAVPGKTPLI